MSYYLFGENMDQPRWARIIWSDGTSDRIRVKSAGDIHWLKAEDRVTVDRIAALGYWDLPAIKKELGL